MFNGLNGSDSGNVNLNWNQHLGGTQGAGMNSNAGGFPQVNGGNMGGFPQGAGNAGMGSNPQIPQSISLSDKVFITGFIASRKNALGQSYPKTKSKDVFKDLVAKKLQGTKKIAKKEQIGPDGKPVIDPKTGKPVIIEEVVEEAKPVASITIKKLDSKGDATDATVTIDDKTKFSIVNFRSLSWDVFKSTIHGYYEVKIKETTPEYVAIVLKDRLNAEAMKQFDLADNSAEIPKMSAVTNKNQSVALIKPKELVYAMLTTKTQQLNVASVTQSGEIAEIFGSVVPSLTRSKSTTATNRKKYNAKLIVLDMDGKQYNKLGELPKIPGAVNYNFVEDNPPATVIEITNSEKYFNIFGKNAVDPKTLGVTKKYVKAEDMPNKVPMKVSEKIPYNVYASQYKKMMVTEEMLEEVRKGSTSSGSKKIKASDINDIYTKSTQAYQEMKRINSF